MMIMSEKFNLEKEIEEYPVANMFKSGLKYYIQSRKIKINNKKDLDKIVKEYGELKIGE